MFKFCKKNNFFQLTIIFCSLMISSNNSLLSNEKEIIIEKSYQSIIEPFNIKEKYNYFRQLAYSCAVTSYSKSEIKQECDDGPSSFDRVLRYNSFSNYISSHSYHSNGLNYVTSTFVDEDTHHYGNFMNDGVGIILLYIIDCLMILGWVPLLCCWRRRFCLFGDCIYQDGCCVIFWHIMTYILAAMNLSFLIVVLCFGQ